MTDTSALNAALDERISNNYADHVPFGDGNDSMKLPDRPGITLPSAADAGATSVVPTSPSMSDEVSFIDGFTSAGLVTANSYWEYEDYKPDSFKVGAPTLGTGATVTFSFDASSNFTAQEKESVIEAMAEWEAVANVTFVEDDNPADAATTDLNFHRGNDGGAYTETNQTQGVGATPGSPTGQVTISIDTSVPGFDLSGSFTTVGGYGRGTIVHELGHFLGLGHGGAYNGNVNPATQQYSAFDSRQWSIMSYIGWYNTNAKYASQYTVTGTNWGISGDSYYRATPYTPQDLDIEAIQQLYGAAQTTPFTGGQVYGFNTNITGPLESTFDFTKDTTPVVTLYNQGTGNTLDLSGYTMAERVDLHAGTFSDVGGLKNNVGIAFGTAIDTAIGGSGNDSLTANDNGDTLIGGAGADALIGGAGSDTASYRTSTAGVTADLADATQNTGDAAGDTYTSIENLTGSAYADTLTGDANANIIEGGAGGDVLTGGGGNDTLSYAHSSAGVNVSLGDQYFAGGDAQGDTASGFTNIIGSAFNDTLIGAGGDPATLDGGAGDDSLYAAGPGDTLIGGSGADVLSGGGPNIASYVTATIGVTADLSDTSQNTGDAAGDYYEGIRSLTGSSYNDTLIGDANANVLTGGAGDDTLEGMGGGDSFVGGDGTDTVSYAWSNSGVIANLANSSANTLDATGDSYSGIENLTGTSVNDTLIGDGGDNVLDGGAGGDLFFGGGGNDTVTYADSSSGVGVFLYDNNAYDGDAQGDSLIGISNLIGSAFDDFLISNSQGDGVLNGGSGNDKLYSEAQSGTVTLIGGAGADTLADYAPGGTVIASYSTASSGVLANLTDASQNTGDAAGDSYIGIENLAGSAFSDSLTGDANANTLSGAAGDDLLVGGAGTDTLDGGDGNDTLDGGAGADALIGGTGYNVATYRDATAGLTVNLANTAANTGDAAGDTYSNVENVEGTDFNDTLTGDASANILDGGAGNDTFIATGGGDTFIGGDGNDTVSYANATGAVDAALDYSGYGGNATGDMFHSIETLIGSAYDDVLESSVKGGSTLIGGAGSDELYVDGDGDVLIGGAGGDYFLNDNPDDVTATVSYATATQGITLNLDDGSQNTGDAAGDLFYDAVPGENYLDPGTVGFVILGTTYNDTITGDAGDNTLEGGAGNDVLDGGAGIDTLIGGAGNDTYYVDNAGDKVIEAANGGNDTIDSSVSYNLLGQYVETLTLTGTANINATGNSQANVLNGNSGYNVLDGKAGADIMTGGSGSDTYYVDNVGDKVIEAAGGGNDKIYSSVSYNLLGQYVEAMTLIGTDAINATGNSKANVLNGNSANNVIDGKAGNDVLTGKGGDDTFRFDTALGAGNIDTITDFTVGDDMIQLDRSIFTAIGKGALAANAFEIGTNATSASTRIIYDAGTGDLFYDADGNGAGQKVQFATLSANLALTSSSFSTVG